MSADEIKYSLPDKPWAEELGKHRARVQVDAPAEAVWLHLEWRRRDADPARKRIIVLDAATGKRVDNVARAQVQRESCDLVFQPATAPGVYEVYYLPAVVQPNWGWYGGDYLAPDDKPDAAWLQRNGLTPEALPQGKWRDLPRAKVLEIQARTQFSRFDPMEVVATADETKALLAAQPDRPYLVFAEDRENQIRMTDDLPLRWTKNGPSASFAAEACRNEFRAFQVGVWAARQPVDDVQLQFSALRPPTGGKAVPASAFRCFNLGGTEWDGQPLKKTVSVPQGKVQALWCGFPVPKDAAPGEYRGEVTVSAKGLPPTTVELRFTVVPQVLEDCGDSEMWRMSRLRWLDSTIAIDDEVCAPYTPLKITGKTVQCLGRSVVIGDNGLPTSIKSGTHELLAAPLAFVVETADGAHAVSGGAAKFAQPGPGAVTWESAGLGGPVSANGGTIAAACKSRMEFDGHLTFHVTLKAERDTPVKDIRLEMPFRRDIAKYMMGMGRKGSFRPQEWQWKWGGQTYYDSFWMGDVPVGVQCELRGASYCGPMVNLYWSLGQLKPPTTWDNGGKGGLTVAEDGDKVVARAYSGERTLKAGEEMIFEFALLVTPVKPLDTASHFKTRYYHDYKTVDEIAKTGANTINIHHANELNPYINYPFLAVDKMHAYIKQAHAKGMKVKIYYTLREMTNHVTELFALRSLGHEVIAPGGGGGDPWLREHLGSDYSPAWWQPQPDGEACAAVVNTGMSRWYNYYLEGLQWLAKNVEIDGLYNDDVSYDRQIMKRVRKILQRSRPGSMLDLHSNTAFSHGPANQYMEFFPFIDSLWFGESFNYNETPDYWLTEISGIPYGLMGEMLQDGGNKWRGMIYGMVSRMPWSGDPRSLWKTWDEFGIDKAKMIGYWEPTCPVKTGREDVLATAYVREGKTLISVASWATGPVKAPLKLDWQALGLDPAKTHLYAPEIADFQEEALFTPEDAIPVKPGRGWLLIADQTPRKVAPYQGGDDRAYDTRKLLLEDRFPGEALGTEWKATLSAKPGTKLEVKDGQARFLSLAHSCVWAERALPAGVTLIQARLDAGTDGGMTWGIGIALRWPDKLMRINLRPPEGRVGVDDGKGQWLYPAPAGPGKVTYLRLRIEQEHVFAEVSEDGALWFDVHGFPRAEFVGSPTAVLIGKFPPAAKNEDADSPPNPAGVSALSELRAWGAK